MALNRVIFVGLSGYDYPHTRVRCYNFAEQLNRCSEIKASVLSFKDDLSNLSEMEMYGAGDLKKLLMIMKAFPRLFPKLNTLFYIQKAHYNAALPFLLARMGFNRFIFDYDDYDVDLNVTFNRKPLRKLFFGTDDHERLTQNMASRALGCVAASRNLFDYVSQFNPRVEYISTGVKPELFKCVDRSNREGPVRFLWSGIVWGEEILQGILRIFEGLRFVISAGHDVRLQIAGAGGMWDRMLHILNRDYSEIVEKVEILGWIHPDQMPSVLAGADIGLLPFAVDSVWTRSKSPTKLFEYMASGLPVIADAIGEVTQVIKHEQSGILAKSQDDFNAAMSGLAQNAEMRIRIGNAARNRVETNYSIPVLVDRLARFLEMLIRLQS